MDERKEKLTGIFLKAAAAGLARRRIDDPGLTPDEWNEVMELSMEQSLLPIVFEAVYEILPEELEKRYRTFSLAWISKQMRDTRSFLVMYRQLGEMGIRPLVVKGILCRDAYPLPDWRVSSDEDIYFGRDRYMELHKAMLQLGFKSSPPIFQSEHEKLYEKGGLRIEGHWDLFPRKNLIWEQTNSRTSGLLDRAWLLEVEGVRILAPEPTDHMIYLLLHAMKHFALSGVGIRQICDIVQWDKKYDIDWTRIKQAVTPLGGAGFTAAVLDAGHRYFNMRIPEGWIPSDSTDLIRDALEGGVFGHSTQDRLHSGSITSADGTGHSLLHNIFKTIFPPRAVMEINYPWVSSSRLLLPVGWGVRLFQYAGKIGDNVSPLRSIRIGTQRMQLLEEYGIFRSDHTPEENRAEKVLFQRIRGVKSHEDQSKL